MADTIDSIAAYLCETLELSLDEHDRLEDVSHHSSNTSGPWETPATTEDFRSRVTLPSSTALDVGHPNNSTTVAPSQSSLQYIELFLFTRVVVTICCLGLIGNALNLVVLVPKGIRTYPMGRMEKFAYTGLIALAVSDIFFCIAVIPTAFYDPSTFRIHPRVNFDLIYNAFGNAFINTFTTSSAWLTVTLAVGRYLAVCHPLRAREIIGMTFAKRSIFIIYTGCILFNIPRFWINEIASASCEGDIKLYFLHAGFLRRNPHYWITYQWLYFAFGIAVPLILMAFCNAYLIRALGITRRTRTTLQVQPTKCIVGTTRPITRTLVAIVIMYLILVTPAELITFFKPSNFSSPRKKDMYDLAIAAVNTLQAINFSFNFILYCAINVQFRRSFVGAMSCKRHPPRRSSELTNYSNINSALTSQNCVVNLTEVTC